MAFHSYLWLIRPCPAPADGESHGPMETVADNEFDMVL